MLLFEKTEEHENMLLGKDRRTEEQVFEKQKNGYL